jgi:V8-like Glu-specific endopeptidase
MKKLVLIVLFVAVVCAINAVQAQTLVQERSKRVSKSGRLDSKSKIKFFPVEKGVGEIVSLPIRADQQDGSVKALRLHFKFNADEVQQSGQSGKWCVIVKDLSGKELWTFDSASDSDFEEFWSAELPTDRVKVTITSEVPNSVLKLVCDKKIEYLEPVQEKSIIKEDNTVEITRVTDAKQIGWGKSVARLTFVSQDGDDVLTCTGFLVAPKLFITNDHCPRGDKERKSAIVEFDYDTEKAHTKIYRLKGELARDEPLDFAFFELNKPVSDREPLKLLADPQSLNNGMDLILIQHPAGLPKRLAAKECRVKAPPAGLQPATDFGHECDTQGGSSGSPVQTPSGLVIGIHHYGFDTSIVDPDLQFNQAVKMTEIIKFIKTSDTDKARKVRQFLAITD